MKKLNYWAKVLIIGVLLALAFGLIYLSDTEWRFPTNLPFAFSEWQCSSHFEGCGEMSLGLRYQEPAYCSSQEVKDYVQICAPTMGIGFYIILFLIIGAIIRLIGIIFKPSKNKDEI